MVAEDGAAATGSSEPLSISLAKLRRLTNSSLPHQSKPAQLLQAIESTLVSTLASSSSSSSGTSTPSPTAYFVSLLQCLEKACADEIPNKGDEEVAESENMGQGALIPATLYILALVIPETPSKVVISKSNDLMELLLPLFESAMAHPPALRSLIQISTSVLIAAPPSQLNSSPQLKKVWSILLELNLDGRPKVRHMAQEGIRKVLSTPIPPRSTGGNHPYLPKARQWVTRALEEEAVGGGGSKGKKARFADDNNESKKAIWVVQGLRGWVSVWGDEHLSDLCDRLLGLPPMPHLTQQIYSLLSLLLSPSPHSTSSKTSIQNLPTILESLISSPPDLKSNASDIPSYLSATASVLIKMSFQDPLSLTHYLSRAFNLFMGIMLDPKASKEVSAAASDAIGGQGIARYCLADDAIFSAVVYQRQHAHDPSGRKKSKPPFLTKMINTLSSSLSSHPLKMGELLPIFVALVSRLRLRMKAGEPEIDPTGTGRTAAAELLLQVVVGIADFRVSPGFGEKEKLDDLLGMCIEVMGVEEVLAILPLNVEPDESGDTPQPGRAHLLPLIRSRTTNDSLLFFTSYFRPLSERLFGRKVAADEGGRAAESKVWEVLIAQIWNCFPGFCEMPRDLKDGLTTPFLTLLTNLLYTQPLLLTPLIRGLSSLLTSTQRLATSASPPEELRKQFGVDQTTARANLTYLEALAKDLVSVLLNVFSKLPRDQRAPVGDVIGLWTGIMRQADLVATYNGVTSHLSANLDSSIPVEEGASPVSHTMLDLLIIFTPHLPVTQSQALFTASASKITLEHHDATVQKKTYRLLKRLVEGGKLVNKVEAMEKLVKEIKESEGAVGPGTQRDRLQLLSTVIEDLPSSQLHLIPELLSEAVLGTKELNERARNSAFDLLVIMGQKMSQGGTVKRVNGGDDDGLERDAEMNGKDTDEEGDEGGEEMMDENGGEAIATVEEFITMVAAGLTSTTPHMISASINALSRLVFEFKDQISASALSELVSTTAVFLSSKNREIIKSALGFVKLLIISLPQEIITPHLPVLVPALLGWVHDHKNHFKQKTVHIFERMIRKFGYEDVYRCAPVGGERKVLEGIRKKKERAKKKKENAAKNGADEGDDEADTPKVSSGNAFEDVLYNSDSESDSSDSDADEVPAAKGQKGKTGKAGKKVQGDRGQGYIRAEGDQPLDLLSRSIAGGITKSQVGGHKRKPGQDASHFKTDKSGKLVIDDSDSSDNDAAQAQAGAGSAFLSAQRGVDGQTRTASGAVKFSRNTKRAREEEGGMDLDDAVGGGGGSGGGGREAGGDKVKDRKKRMMKAKLGEEFRAKRGQGDIKRAGGPDPYSYVSLGQANVKKGGGRFNLTNKKKGSRR